MTSWIAQKYEYCVINLHSYTKLNLFLEEYRTTCLLRCETDSYDSEGVRVRTAPWKHVTRDKVQDALSQFRGDIQQAPPMCVFFIFEPPRPRRRLSKWPENRPTES